ncbi:MAG: hypothetical protein QXZ25_01810 [Candidatus Bathyarchaeia archaeon]
MEDFEEALRNIDVFCKVLVKKIVEGESENLDIIVEPMEKLLVSKYAFEERYGLSPLAKSTIPLPHLEEPLIDIFEDENYVKILVQCQCKHQKVTFHMDTNGMEICERKCHEDDEGKEICIDRCQRLELPTRHLQIERATTKCNNSVFELNIPKGT